MPHRKELMQQTMPGLLWLIHGFKYVFGQPKKSDQSTMLQIQVLGTLYVCPESTAKDIGDNLYLSSSATTQLLQRLFEAGWIERKNNPTDRRSIRLSLTDQGRSVLHSYRSDKIATISNVFSVLTDDELQAFVSAITKLNNAIQENKDGNR